MQHLGQMEFDGVQWLQLEQGRVQGQIVQGVSDRGEGGEGGYSLLGGEKGDDPGEGVTGCGSCSHDRGG